MATKYGYQTLLWLEDKGWKAEAISASELTLYGDQRVVDPTNNEPISVYEGVKRHEERTGEFPEFLKEWRQKGLI